MDRDCVGCEHELGGCIEHRQKGVRNVAVEGFWDVNSHMGCEGISVGDVEGSGQLHLNPYQSSPHWHQAHGNTALHMAAALPPGPSQEAIVQRLLAAGADPTLRNLENEQPVHLLRPGPGPEGVSTEPTLTVGGGL